MNSSHSIWNENPVVYTTIKRFYSAIITVIYPFAHYCVLTKSPKKFGFLKWVIYFHCFWITVEWLSNAFLIDILDFQPSVTLKIDGFFNKIFDSLFLYKVYCCIEAISSTSALFLFTSRLLMIVNMYRPILSIRRIICETLIYVVVGIFGLWSIPATIWQLPNQKSAKEEIVNIEPHYPDCIWQPTCIVVSANDTDSEHLTAILTILNWVSIGIAIFVSAKVVFYLLARRMMHESEATRRMHKKFNQRTIFQAILYLSFACIPFSVLYLTILFNVHIPGITYLIDFFSENHPTACAVSLFLYYDPYQNFLLDVVGWKRKISIEKPSTIVDRSTFVIVRC
uniref:Serpentine Receptor, class H n=1 Tax=Caenorhabditis tropicalis TaxID=1561998 RepID=A0A1I7T1N3_9PELO